VRDVTGHTENRPKDSQSAASTVVIDNILDCNYDKVQQVEGTVVSVDNILALHRQNSFYIHVKRCSLSFLQRKNSEQQNEQYGKNCRRVYSFH